MTKNSHVRQARKVSASAPAFEQLLRGIDPTAGLPEDFFLFISRVTPMVNVDLLIKDRRRRTLLTWRDDGFYGAGWHIPGGIVRYKETLAERIVKVGRQELGAALDFDPRPVAISQVIHPTRKARGHFISLLYRCSVRSGPDLTLEYEGGIPEAGQWKWHSRAPKDLIEVQRIYKKWF